MFGQLLKPSDCELAPVSLDATVSTTEPKRNEAHERRFGLWPVAVVVTVEIEAGTSHTRFPQDLLFRDAQKICGGTTLEHWAQLRSCPSSKPLGLDRMPILKTGRFGIAA